MSLVVSPATMERRVVNRRVDEWTDEELPVLFGGGDGDDPPVVELEPKLDVVAAEALDPIEGQHRDIPKGGLDRHRGNTAQTQPPVEQQDVVNPQGVPAMP